MSDTQVQSTSEYSIKPLMKSISEDLSTIEAYVDTYAWDNDEYHSAEGHDKAKIEDILFVWAKNKVNLYKLFGNQVMVHKNISIRAPEHELTKKVNDLVYDNQFIADYRDKILMSIYDQHSEIFLKYYSDLSEEEKDIVHFHKFFQRCICTDALLNNSVQAQEKIVGKTFICPDGTKIQIPKEIKTFRMLNKLSKAYDIPSFENFRIAYSQIFNDSKLTGRLTLSIHPLDYMTMSDNNCSWSSCMSWMDRGDYRLGTVEMMNSPKVIVAYLESQEPFYLWNSYDESYMEDDVKKTWSNKKWRCLFIVDEGYLIKVKGYPYQCKDLENEVFTFLMELAKENCGWTYYPDDIDLKSGYDTLKGTGNINNISVRFNFHTQSMYNDMYHSAKSHCRISDKEEYEELCNDGYEDITYSGQAQCMWCGDVFTYFESESRLLCSREYAGVRCEHCGEYVHEDEAYYDSEGYAYCEDCYHEIYVQDFTTCSDIDRDSAVTIFAFPKSIWEKLQHTYLGEFYHGDEDAEGYTLPKYAVDEKFLINACIPFVYTDCENLYDPQTPFYSMEEKVEWMKEHIPWSYFVRLHVPIPEAFYDKWGNILYYYVYDPDDEVFMDSRLGRDFRYQNYLGYASKNATSDYKRSWNSHILWRRDELEYNNIDHKKLLFNI